MADNGVCVTIGVFDGVHRGHQALISAAVEHAQREDQPAVVVTFDPNPLEILRPEVAPTRLTSIERRMQLITELQVDDVVVLPFSQDLAAMTAQEFIDRVLYERLGARAVVIGHGFRFGNRAKGTADTLREAGLAVHEIDLLAQGEPVSSTRIRAAVAAGDMRDAALMLGRSSEVEGVVVRGQQRGRDLGYPTANIDHHALAAVPADGVYAGRTHVAGRIHEAAISVGSNPTFGGSLRTVESHLLDFDEDIYGQHVRVEFVERLRGMETFAGIDELIATMSRDVQRTREVLAS